MHIFPTQVAVDAVINGRSTQVFEKTIALTEGHVFLVYPVKMSQGDYPCPMAQAYVRDRRSGKVVQIQGKYELADVVSHLPLGQLVNVHGEIGRYWSKKRNRWIPQLTMVGFYEPAITFPAEEDDPTPEETRDSRTENYVGANDFSLEDEAPL